MVCGSACFCLCGRPPPVVAPCAARAPCRVSGVAQRAGAPGWLAVVLVGSVVEEPQLSRGEGGPAGTAAVDDYVDVLAQAPQVQTDEC